jgi:hypothetical protein
MYNHRLCLGQKATKAQIVHYILDFLDSVLDAIAAFSQRVILKIQYLEAGMDVFDELADL